MDLEPDDWERAQDTGEVPLGQQGYIRLFMEPISPGGPKSLVSVKVSFTDEGVLRYGMDHVLYKSSPQDGCEWQVWHFTGCLPLKDSDGLVFCERME